MSPSSHDSPPRAATSMEQLVSKYQLRWAHQPDQPYPVDYYGSVGAGWLPLVEELVIDLIELGWDRQVAQVKEKFGGLRFYIGVGSADIAATIDRAQERSFEICEECGRPGRLRDGPYLLVRCDEHAPAPPRRCQ